MISNLSKFEDFKDFDKYGYRTDLTREEAAQAILDLKKIELSWKNVDDIIKFLKHYKDQNEDYVIDYILHLLDNCASSDINIYSLPTKVVRSFPDICNMIRHHHCGSYSEWKEKKREHKREYKLNKRIINDLDPYGEEDWSE